MNGFKITTQDGQEIKFEFYVDTAPVTSIAFQNILPFSRTFNHARVSGQEIWIDVVFGPTKPSRTKTANCFGIYYGEGKGLDACNIFAKVVDTDKQKLFDLGNSIWKYGSQELTLSKLEK